MRKGADMHNRDDFFMHQIPRKLMMRSQEDGLGAQIISIWEI